MNRAASLSVTALLASAGVSMAADPAPAAPAVAPAAETRAEIISQADLLARMKAGDADLVVLDVRTPAEFAAGHVPGARNVSHDQLTAKLAELSSVKDKEVVLYCRSGRRTALAEQTLRGAGFTRLRHLEGDYLAWEAEKKPVETSSEAK